MPPVIIVLLIIGGLFLGSSFLFGEKSSSKLESRNDRDGIKEDKIVKEEIKHTLETTLSAVTEETIIKTEDELSKLSNEKIIAVHDFSNQVLNKINMNHEEVIFLYNMLNEKEQEIKRLLTEADVAKNNFVKNGSKNNGRYDTNLDQLNLGNVNANTVERFIQDYQKETNAKENNSHKTSISSRKSKKEKSFHKNAQLYSDNQTAGTKEEGRKENYNKEIIALYNDGASVMEIAKALELGQGEVKLVIDLYVNRG